MAEGSGEPSNVPTGTATGTLVSNNWNGVGTVNRNPSGPGWGRVYNNTNGV